MHFKIYLLLVSSFITYSLQNDEKKLNDTFCHKWKKCVPDGKKMCGYDKEAIFIMIFRDLCSIYEFNCKKLGLFYPVDMIFCETEFEFMNSYNNNIMSFRPPLTIRMGGKDVDVTIPELENKIGNQ